MGTNYTFEPALDCGSSCDNLTLFPLQVTYMNKISESPSLEIIIANMASIPGAKCTRTFVHSAAAAKSKAGCGRRTRFQGRKCSRPPKSVWRLAPHAAKLSTGSSRARVKTAKVCRPLQPLRIPRACSSSALRCCTLP